MFTKQQIQIATGIIVALGEAIRASQTSALGGIPSGELYAVAMAHLDLRTYEAAINGLKRANLVVEKNHLLIWVGPKETIN
jgi:hypothetical protein